MCIYIQMQILDRISIQLDGDVGLVRTVHLPAVTTQERRREEGVYGDDDNDNSYNNNSTKTNNHDDDVDDSNIDNDDKNRAHANELYSTS